MGTPRTRILYNAAICRRCGDTIESAHQHHFAACSCGALAVDGGLAYLRRLGNKDDWTDLAPALADFNVRECRSSGVQSEEVCRE